MGAPWNGAACYCLLTSLYWVPGLQLSIDMPETLARALRLAIPASFKYQWHEQCHGMHRAQANEQERNFPFPLLAQWRIKKRAVAVPLGLLCSCYACSSIRTKTTAPNLSRQISG